MDFSNNRIPLWEEHLFWLEMLQDHAYFVRDHLSPSEVQYVNVSQQYIQFYGDLISSIKKIPRSAKHDDLAMIEFARKVWPVAKGFFDFEGHLQTLRIDNEINLNLSPTYLNGTLSENQEYLRILTQLVNGIEPAPLPVSELMELWLGDQLGHALLFENMLDPIEFMAIQQAQAFKSKFQVFIVQNHHFKGYFRFKAPGFARQQDFLYEVGQTVLEMNEFIRTMIERYKENRLLNKTNLRFLEHHFPETCYFLMNLSYYEPRLQAEVGKCSLTKPSFN